jgi:dihydrofolate reductase
MARLRVHSFAMSVDGFAAGPDQSLDDPLGVGGSRLHDWVFATRFGAQMLGDDGGEEGVDDELLRRGVTGIGATVMGRNMFGPVRGDWGAEGWRGWWGDDPPFHHPVFVLTHHPRRPIEMAGGTTFEFVTDGIEAALRRAVDAAGGLDVRLGGGVSTVQQYLRAGLVDDLHVAVVPVLLGRGERLFDNLGGALDAYACAELVCSPSVAHVRFARAD